MKTKKIIPVFIMVLFLITACEKDNNLQENNEYPIELGVESSEKLSDDLLVSEIIEALEFFEAMKLDNEVAYVTMSKIKGKLGFINYEVEPKNENILARHSYSTTSRLKFATWCNDQLLAGNCLKIGMDGDTYWADIVDC